jgi:hypothetical protein
MKNYVVGPPITELDCFYGRHHQINRFFNMVQTTLQPLRILGLDRSGKTSFLRYVSNKKISSRRLQGMPFTIVIAYVDMSSRVVSPADFYLEVVKAITSSIDPSFVLQTPSTFPEFRLFSEWLTTIFNQSKELRLVVLLDDFDLLIKSPRFNNVNDDFWGPLRSLVGPQFTWVTACYQDLYTIKNEKGSGSPFFNVFHPTPIILGSLESEECQRLICEPASDQGINFTPKEVETIQNIAGPLPYFLQIVAEEWFRAKKAHESFEQCSYKILVELLSNPHIRKIFSGYWENLMTQEQDYLRQIIQKDSAQKTGHDIERNPLDYGLLRIDGDHVGIAGELFASWLCEYLSKPQDIARRRDPTPKQSIHHLQRLLLQYEKNLQELQQQQAMYGMQIPLTIVNEVRNTKKKIRQIKQKLAQLHNPESTD